MSQKSSYYLFINIVNIILFILLAATGILNWLLPRGYEGGGFLVSVRHFMRDIHEWAGFIFIIFGIIHIVVHWTYIKNNLKKYGILKENNAGGQ